MAKSVMMGGALITFVNADFKCPACEFPHTEEHYYDRLRKHTLIYQGCKGCKRKLGITTDIMGDVVVWLKSEENNKD